MRRQASLALASLLIASLAAIGCGPSAEEKAATEKAQKAAAAYTAMEAAKTPLDAKREELKAARAAAEAAEEDAAAELTAKADAIEKEANQLADAFSGSVTDYINSSSITQGAPLNAEQRKAFDYLAQEQILIAQDYIDKGGDYRKAIDIYTSALSNDSDNAALLAAKEKAERLRYMTEERFAAVKKGMTQAEVRALLGTVRQQNVRNYKERARIAWFYPREDSGAAGVFFKEKVKDKGPWIVEIAQFEAVKPGASNE